MESNEDQKGVAGLPASMQGMSPAALEGLWLVTEPTRENPSRPSIGSPRSPGALIEKLQKVGAR
jgi:hypothetical protein